MDFLKIADPDKPGDYLVLAKRDFDPAVHTLFAADPPPEAPGTPAPAPAAPVPAAASAPAVDIATLSVAQAIPIIEAATTREALEALQAQEAARPQPRTGIVKALAAKIDALTAQG